MKRHVKVTKIDFHVFIDDREGNCSEQLSLIEGWFDACLLLEESRNFYDVAEVHEQGVYDLLLKLKQGDTLLVASLTVLSKDAETLAQILYSILHNGVTVIPVQESDFFDLTPYNWESTFTKHTNYLMLPDTNGIEHLKFIARSVLEAKNGRHMEQHS